LKKQPPAKTGRQEDTAMKGQSRAERRRSRREAKKGGRPDWATLEEFARLRIQSWLQELLEEEITELLGRRKSKRQAAVDAVGGIATGTGRCGGWR